MAIAKVFKNQIQNCKVIHPDGRIILFFKGKHITTIKKDIDYLEELAQESGSYVFIDPEESEIDTEDMTEEGRIAKLKREAIEEYKAQQALAANHVSTSTQGALIPGDSKTVAPASAESLSGIGASIGGVKVTMPSGSDAKVSE